MGEEEKPKKKCCAKKDKFQKHREKYAEAFGSFSVEEDGIKDGVVTDRQATDKCWTFVLIVFVIAFFGINIYGITGGDLKNYSAASQIDHQQMQRQMGEQDLPLWQFGVCLVTALIFNFGYINLMSRHPQILGRISIALIELLFILAIGGFGAAGASAQDPNQAPGMYAAAGVVLLIAMIFNCLLCCYWSQMEIAICVVDSAADFYAATKRIMLVSVGTFILALVLVAFWGYGSLMLISMNEIVAVQDASGQVRDQIVWKPAIAVCFGVSTFAVSWLTRFLSDGTGFVAMVSASQYYFSCAAGKDGEAEVMQGVSWAYTKHCGSLALGSLVHTLISMLRQAAESGEDNGGGAAKLVACVILCCLRCIEGLIDYINRLSYAYMAISGQPYCTSAKHGFLLNLKHCVKFYFAQTIGGFFVFMGSLLITLVNTALFVGLLAVDYPNTLGAQAVPILVMFVVNYAICMTTMGLFDEAIMATLLCLAVDMDLNHGTPKFGSATFQESMKKIIGEDKAGDFHDPAEIQMAEAAKPQGME